MFKPSYSYKEMKELREWFQQRKGTLPKELQLNKSTFIPNVERTVDALLQALRGRDITARMAGLATHLAEIREKIEADEQKQESTS